jgi:hypothetical protein
MTWFWVFPGCGIEVLGVHALLARGIWKIRADTRDSRKINIQRVVPATRMLDMTGESTGFSLHFVVWERMRFDQSSVRMAGRGNEIVWLEVGKTI